MKKPLLFALWFVFASAVSVPAQVASAPARATAAKAASDEVVVLDVFTVRPIDEDEYRAVNTTTGTRYNKPVKDLPMNIEVLTSAFLRDTGIFELREALEYVSGVQLDTTAGSLTNSRDNPEAQILLVRGISSAVLRDGFKRFIPQDAITIDRVDILKGPGGALYGQGAGGGVVQTSSVRAGSKPRTYLGQTLGSFGYRRTEFLWSGPLDSRQRFGFALPMAYQSSESTVMYFTTRTFTCAPALTWRITPRTTLLASWESRFYTRDNIRNLFVNDSAKAPDGSNYGIFIPGRAGTTPLLRLGNDQRDFRFDGPDTYRTERNYFPTLRVDHAFSERLQFWAGINYEITHVKEHSWNYALRNFDDTSIPLAVRNYPRFQSLIRPGFGTAKGQVLDMRPVIVNDNATIRPTYKTELYWAFNLGPINNRMVVGGSYGRTRAGAAHPATNFYYPIVGSTKEPAKAVTAQWEALPLEALLYRFRDPRDYTTVRRWDSRLINLLPHGPEAVPGEPGSYVTTYFYDRNLYANLQSGFFNDRLQTIAGFLDARNDRQADVFDANGRFVTGVPAPPVDTATTQLPNGAARPNGVRRPQAVKQASPSLTAIWLVNDHVRLYGNMMSALDPGVAYSAYDGNGRPLTAPVITNHEAGLRFDAFNSKLLFNILAFKMTRKDLPSQLGGSINNQVVNLSNGSLYNSGIGQAFVNSDTESEGFDVKMDYLPVRNFRVNLSFSRTDATITKVADYVAPANPNPTFLASQLAYLATGASSKDYLGRNPDDLSKYSAAGYLRYEFAGRFAKGLWLMLGSKYIGKREAELVSVNTTTGAATIDRRIVPERYIFDLNLGYRTRFRSLKTDFRLNIANLGNNQKFYGVAWQAPRTIRLSASASF